MQTLLLYKSGSSFPNCLSRQNVQVDIFHNKKFSWPHYESFVRSRWMDTGFVLSRVFSHLEFLSIQNKKGLANAQPSWLHFWSKTLISLLSILFLPSFLFFFLAALSQKRIDLPSMLGVYVVMGCGITAAFITLIAEIFWKKMTKKRETKPSCFKRYKDIFIKVRPTGKSSLVSLLFWVGKVCRVLEKDSVWIE